MTRRCASWLIVICQILGLSAPNTGILQMRRDDKEGRRKVVLSFAVGVDRGPTCQSEAMRSKARQVTA